MRQPKFTAVNLRRTSGKVQRLAYDLERDASRLREMHPFHSEALHVIATSLNSLARRMDEELASK